MHACLFLNKHTFLPITKPTENLWNFPTLFITSYIWYANSRVGVIIKAPSPSKKVQLLEYNNSNSWKERHLSNISIFFFNEKEVNK